MSIIITTFVGDFMAFNTLEYLEQGKADFIFRMTLYDRTYLINSVRNSERRDLIIAGFLPKLIEDNPYFCFEIIYDNPKYKKEAWELLNSYYKFKDMPKEKLMEVLYDTSYGSKYLKEHFSEAIDYYKNDLYFIFEYMMKHYSEFKSEFNSFAISKDMNQRYLMMLYLIDNNRRLFKKIYGDLTKYLVDYTYTENEQLELEPEKMSSSDISYLAFKIFESPLRKDYYERIKEFIASNYPKNEIVYHLLDYKEKRTGDYSFQWIENRSGINEFKRDPDWYFKTASRGKLLIAKKYSQVVSSELMESYKKFTSYFASKKHDSEYYLYRISSHNLENKLEEYVTKYLDLSHTDEHYYIASGSTSDCFRIGDYVFKLDRMKWSYEEVICPNLYIILPNLEEIFIRDNEGIVRAGIEIQKYLELDAQDVPKEVWKQFKEELSNLGYYTTDTLINGVCGDNCRMLDSYEESGNLDAPDWFKQYPVVIVDRDRIYRKRNIYPKQLRSSY